MFSKEIPMTLDLEFDPYQEDWPLDMDISTPMLLKPALI